MIDKEIIVIFGGSFNPPINSHFSLAEDLIKEFTNIKKVIFVPVGSKYNKHGLIDNEHRYNMLKCITDKNDRLDVSRIELENDRQLYSFETLEYFNDLYKDKNIYFAIGSDNLKEFTTWHLYEDILNNFKVIVFKRNHDDIEGIINNDSILKIYKDGFIIINNNNFENLSSTHVRKLLENLDIYEDKINKVIPEEVYKYIKDNNLYSN